MKKTYEEALRYARFSAMISGAITQINGKRLTADGGFLLLDGVRVEDVETEVIQHIQVNEAFVKSLMV